MVELPAIGRFRGVMQCMAALNNTTYKAALYTFDLGLNTLATLTLRLPPERRFPTSR